MNMNNNAVQYFTYATYLQQYWKYEKYYIT